MEDLWTFLADAGRPIVLYGTGNGCDKILDALHEKGLEASGLFASDGFVRNRTFRGFPVLSYDEARRSFGDDMVILPAFGTNRPEVIGLIYDLDRRHTLRMPDVPLYGGPLFDADYAAAHREEWEETGSLFADERSRSLFRSALDFRLTGLLRDLADTEPVLVTLRSLFGHEAIRTAVDGGAYCGDSTRDMIRAFSPKTVYAVEADPKTFEKLRLYASSEPDATVIPVWGALRHEDGTVTFSSSGSRGSGEHGRNRRARETAVPALTLDAVAPGTVIDFIKLDVEGSELKAIEGGLNRLVKDEPNLSVSVYHKTDDIVTIPALLHRILPGHRLFLRRPPCLPLWDLTVYAVRPR